MGISLQKMAEIGSNAALEKKALDVSVFDIRGVSSATDFSMICSGESTRQVQAIADEVIAKLKEAGERPVGVEGYDIGKWILLDYSDMVVHVFHSETRKYYEIERLWEGVPEVDLRSSSKMEEN